MTAAPENLVASIRQRLLNYARSEKLDFNALLIRYATERFLYRLSRSSYRDRFILKGALLFAIWEGHLPRITKDVDLLSFGSSETEAVMNVVGEICEGAVETDGLEYLRDSITSTIIREGQGNAS